MLYEVITRRTGLSADVIRAWERRYQAVSPERTQIGRRLSSDRDIARLALLRRAIHAGRRIFARDAAVERALAQGAIGLAQRAGCSSVHVTFADVELCARLAPLGYLTRAGIQYHWFNRGYSTFDGFLADLSSPKRT